MENSTRTESWRKLPRGKEIEWDKPDQAYAKGSAGFVVLLNDEPHYWDLSKLQGTYHTMFGRH